MTHSRACPKCGKIIPWHFDKAILKKMPNGEIVPVRHARLICPEHGEFRSRAKLKALKEINGL